MNDHHMIEWQEKGGGGICKGEGGWGAKGAKLGAVNFDRKGKSTEQ